MRYGSVCSGIEAATTAWHPLGWEPAFFSEIEPFPRAVLAHHYPAIPCHGDFTTIGTDDYGPIDLLVGGTPCQSFSIAGLRGGLDDDRGNLALEFLRLADRKRPQWLVWENVPGVLSSNGGRDFGAILGGMVELRYGIAYRVLDAQFFGVPQRRRRVFVVGYLGDWRRAAAVLFERHSLSGHPAPRRQAGAGSAAGTLGGTSPGGGWRFGADEAAAGHLISEIVGQAMSSKWSKGTAGPAGPAGDEHHNLIPCQVAQTLRARDMSRGVDSGCTDTLIAYSLRGEGFDASEDGTGRGRPLVPVAFDTTQITSAANYSNPKPGDACHPLAAGAHPPAVAFDLRGRENGSQFEGPHDTANIRAASGGSSRSYVAATAVRRLTPRECERLQGFPDDYTLVPMRGKSAADGPRYKALGNSMAVPVMRWIGERIAMVDAFQNKDVAA